MLGHLRFPVERSKGRRYPEPEHPYRNTFQRDRDRITHARAFRRLEAKTQVFTPGLCDHFRNRLTHTIEVAQIARTLANVLGLDEDLTEALALAHDIGHPPFSHAGEEALNRHMRRFGSRFDHNLHAVRIVESFEQRFARFPGLNLSFEVREGIAKHSRDFAPGEFPELDEYLPGCRPPLEAQLIDAADEIAYNTADLDDAFSAGLLTPEDLAAELPFYRELYDAAETQFPGATAEERFHETLRCLIDSLVSGLLDGTSQGAAAAGVQNVEDVRRYPRRLVAFTSETEIADRELKHFLHRHVYASPALSEERTRAAAMIADLFDFFVEHPERLPASHSELVETQPAFRVVCDYIAGMTDGFFQRTYRQMIGPPSPPPA
ncbi:MAG: deoxyguanosinetriphosphate triphosphohydrolase [Bryobacteraceae bacterium]